MTGAAGPVPTARPFRAGDESDTAALRALAAEWGTGFWSVDDVLGSLGVPGTHLWALPRAGAVDRWDGMVLWREAGDEAELLWVFTAPSARGRGLGVALLEALCESCLPAVTDPRVFLEVRPSNAAALRLYGHAGFVLGGRRRAYYKDGEDALIMVRQWRRGMRDDGA